MCKVVNRRVDQEDVYIGRGSRWGNPYRIGVDGNREQVIRKYAFWFTKQIESDTDFLQATLALRGKALGCYCKPLDCHGDVIQAWLAAQDDLSGKEPEMTEIKLAIVGSRSFSDYDLLKSTVAKVKSTIVEIVSGGAKGADTLGAKYANELSIPLRVFYPKWKVHGRSAGYKRNKLIADRADAVIAFWDGTSPGTKHMIELAQSTGKPVHVVRYGPTQLELPDGKETAQESDPEPSPRSPWKGAFSGDWFFLSNYYSTPVEYEGITYPTSEHAYVAAKSLDRDVRERVAKIKTPGQAKAYGRKLDLREDWLDVRNDVMLEILRSKFNNGKLATRLLATAPKELIEANNWHDNYWGICSCNKDWCTKRNGGGQNMLGKLLMQVRREHQELNDAATPWSPDTHQWTDDEDMSDWMQTYIETGELS